MSDADTVERTWGTFRHHLHPVHLPGIAEEIITGNPPPLTTFSILASTSIPTTMAQPNRERQNIIDAQICQLERELLELKRERNELSPISALPPEILCRILLLATSFDRHTTYYNELPDVLRAERCIGTLCHVSHFWRLTALGCPELWADVDIGEATDPRRVDFMLRNAHPHPISFLIKFGDTSIVDKLLQVAQPQTLRALYLDITDTRFPQEFTATGLRIAQHPIFARETPGLRDLMINGAAIPLPSPILVRSPQLTFLSLPVQEGGTLSQVLDVLRNTPLLERLCLELAPLQSPGAANLKPVHLPHLLHQFLGGDSSSVTTLLSHLRVPRMNLSLAVECDVQSQSSLQQEGANFFRSFGEARRSPSELLFSPYALCLFGSPINREGMSRLRIGGRTLDTWSKGVHAASDPENAVVDAVFQTFGTRSGLDPKEWHPLFSVQDPKDLPQLVGWSMDELRFFEIGDGSVHPDSLLRLLSQCPKLSDLTIHLRQVAAFITRFCMDECKGVSTFPSLSRLQVHCAGGPPSVKNKNGQTFFDLLLISLETRQFFLRKRGALDTWVLEKLVLVSYHHEADVSGFARSAKDRGLITEVLY
ncbi:hypothetical protein NMY22_g2766 [Coprinellus aureogranulatus]|nr:hypothetical protein NMY22_g2766 [Coprinellus aureogranulatus]